MLRGSVAVKVLVVVAAYMTTLGVLRYKPWRQARADATPAVAGVERQVLKVGFLPVT